MLEKSILKYKSLLMIVLSIFLFVSVVFANSAKPMQDPSGNGGLIFDENPGIALLSETVSFYLMDPEYITQADVTVEYEMKNLLDQDQSFDMYFVVPPLRNYESEATYTVSLDGEDVTNQSTYKSIELPNNWQPNLPQGFVEPYSKESYNTHFEGDRGYALGINRNKLNGINIPFSIKSNSSAKLLIQYNCEGGYNRTPKFLHTVYNYIYYLTPAKFWNQEPQVTLNVTMPDSQSYALNSSIPMEKVSQNSYTAKLDSLPDSEWAFSFVDKKGLIYNTNTSSKHALITVSISIVLLIMGIIASWRFSKRIFTIFGYILSVAYFYMFKGIIIDGYIGEFLVMVPISITLILIIPIAYYVQIR